jgi:Iron-containing redox enzyme
MISSDPQWTEFAAHLDGSGFALFQRELAKFNGRRLEPSLPTPIWRQDVDDECRVLHAEGAFVERVREEVKRLVNDVPRDVDRFIDWFERLRQTGPGQGDPLFPWLATQASLEQMKWFLEQEVAGEAGFDDLLALTQVKIPEQAKLEMARNFWDEMGRGASKGMHGPMLARLANYVDVHPTPETVVPEALALGNMMIALAHNRRYAFQSIGALGAIEMTAPTRAGYVDRGLRRLGIPAKKRHYFALHAVLDVKHSETWNREVLRPLVAEDPRRAPAIAEGAVIRLWHGARCFERYRREFKLSMPDSRAA